MEGLIILLLLGAGGFFVLVALRGGSLTENLSDLFGAGGGRSGGDF